MSYRKGPFPNKFMPQVLIRVNNFTVLNIHIKMKKKKMFKNHLLSQRNPTQTRPRVESGEVHTL